MAVAPADWANEFELCRAWTRLARSLPLTTTDGRSVDLIHLGVWTHGLGPDFRDALLCIDNGPVVSGAIEIHLRSRGWVEHGHHLDPAFNTVELHVVAQYDPVEIRRADGRLVPTIVLNAAMTGPVPEPADWSIVGGEVCAERLALDKPALIRDAIGRLGDRRMSERTATIEGLLQTETPEPVLFRRLLDALGYTRNRTGMSEVAGRVPWAVVAAIARRGNTASADLAALLLGVGGYLPMSDVEIERAGLDPSTAAGLTPAWQRMQHDFGLDAVPATIWELGRIRPGNHPALRLVQAAALVAACEGQLSGHLLEPIREGVDPSGEVQLLVARFADLRLGEDRARAIATNVLLPFAFALGQQIGDTELITRAGEIWEAMPGAESNEHTRRATRQVSGEVGIRRQGARIQQGLILLDRTLCEPRRCFECPIASLVLAEGAVSPVPALG